MGSDQPMTGEGLNHEALVEVMAEINRRNWKDTASKIRKAVEALFFMSVEGNPDAVFIGETAPAEERTYTYLSFRNGKLAYEGEFIGPIDPAVMPKAMADAVAAQWPDREGLTLIWRATPSVDAGYSYMRCVAVPL